MKRISILTKSLQGAALVFAITTGEGYAFTLEEKINNCIHRCTNLEAPSKVALRVQKCWDKKVEEEIEKKKIQVLEHGSIERNKAMGLIFKNATKSCGSESPVTAGVRAAQECMKACLKE